MALSGGFVHVVAAAIIGADDRVLIAQRPAGKHLAGGWEFPGGKLEPGEDRESGLRRELLEEVGIRTLHCRPLLRLRHAYADRNVLLDVWLVDRYTGVPAGLDGQALRWCTRAELAGVDLLAADRPVVTALRLPATLDDGAGSEHVVVPFNDLAHGTERGADSRIVGALCASAAEACAASAAGADFLVIDAALPQAEVAQCCDRAGLPVFVRGSSLEEAWALGAAGLYRGGATGGGRKTV